MLINRKKLLAMIPLSERTIYNMEQRGEFPRRIALTRRNVAWDLAEVEQWIEARKRSGEAAARPGVTPPAAAGPRKKAPAEAGANPLPSKGGGARSYFVTPLDFSTVRSVPRPSMPPRT